MLPDDPTDDFVFEDLAPLTKRVVIGADVFWLTEASEDAHVRYQTARARTLKIKDDSVVGVEGAGSVEPLLVSRCLYRGGKDGTLPLKDGAPDQGHLVPEPVIRLWPARVVKPLYDWINLVSALDGKDTEEGLTKQISFLQKRLDKLRGTKGVLPNGAAEEAVPTS